MAVLRFRRFVSGALMALTAAAAPAATVIDEPALTVEGSGFRLLLADGKVMEGTQLQGASLMFAVDGSHAVELKLEKISPDPKDPDILRHEFRVRNAAGQWVSACPPNYYGATWGLPVLLPQGHPGRTGAITLACASDAVGKCVRFGYKPWKPGPHGEDLIPWHAACFHMVPADYCGTRTPHTKEGTAIDFYDDLGIQNYGTVEGRDWTFEAGWGPQGAVCVARTRWPDLIGREALSRSCPRLTPVAGKPCTEASARAAGALLFNRARRKPRTGE